MKRAWVLATAIVGLQFLVSGPTSATPAGLTVCNGNAYLVRSAGSAGSPSELLRIDPASGSATSVARLPMQLNALGAHRGALYAIARPDPATLAPGATLTAYAVQVAHDGSVTTIGAIAGAPSGGFRDAYAGTIFAGSWYLLHKDELFTLTVPDIGGPQVTGQVQLSRPVRVGDWTADNDGLITVSTLPGERAALIRVDPVTGAVATLAEPDGLPRGSVYGAVWRAGAELFALHNGTGTLYRIGLRKPYPVSSVLAGIDAASADAAWCAPTPAAPVPPGSPPPASPPPVAASPSPEPSASPSIAESPIPGPPPAAPEPAPATPSATQSADAGPTPLPSLPPLIPPKLAPPPELLLAPPPPPEPALTPEQRKRRWSAASAVVITLSGIAGIRALSRRR